MTARQPYLQGMWLCWSCLMSLHPEILNVWEDCGLSSF